MSLIDSWQGKRVLVVGDLMVDQYLWGDSSRISPEAPVPVVDVTSREIRPGGAANAALNVKALGAEVVLAGLVGEDKLGESLKDLLDDAGFDTSALIQSAYRRTTVKTRVMSRGQQLLRIDEEDLIPMNDVESEELLEKRLASLGDIDAILISDYDKGLISEPLIKKMLGLASAKEALITVDPKYDNFFSYQGCSLFKPNLRELNDACGLQLKGAEHDEIRQAVLDLRKKMPHGQSLVTLGRHGMLAINEQGETSHIPARLREVVDVSGAGDTTIAVVTLALCAGASLEAAARLSNEAAGIACEMPGVVPVSKEMLQAV